LNNFLGAFGVVYLAKWRNAQCVVKKIKKDITTQRIFQDFLREMKNMK